jgi:glucokinase
MITLGTGVGGGIIIDGKVYSGFNCAGGELGHAVIVAGGRPCGCGRKGCWEAYSSATGLINMTKDKLLECEKSGRKTVMTELVEKYGKVNGRVAFDAMRAGDEAGKEVVDEYVYYLGIGLANMVNLFQPEVLSIGGGISNEGQTLLDLVEPIVRKEQYGGDFAALTQLRIAELKNDAGIIGAATLGL